MTSTDLQMMGLMAALLTVPGAAIQQFTEHLVHIDAGGEVPIVELDLREVVGTERVTSPTGDPGVRIVLDPEGPIGTSDPEVATMLLVVPGDVAFVPDLDAAQRRLLGDRTVDVIDVPPVLGWSEVVRILDEWDDADLDRSFALALVAAAGVEGARRVGVDVTSLDPRVDEVATRLAAR